MNIAGWIFPIILIGFVTGILLLLYVFREKIRQFFEKKKNKTRQKNSDGATVSGVVGKLKQADSLDFWLPEVDVYKKLGNEMDRLEKLVNYKERK